MRHPPLEIKNLVKNYGKTQAVKGVSFTLNEGEIFGLLGPNGAGKTSIIATIVTLEEPTSGEIFVNGHKVENNSPASKLEVGFVPQEIVNHGFFDTEEILHFVSGYYGLRQNKERIDYLLNQLGLFEHRKKKVKQLSGGMKRRLMIAKALVHSPKLLLLDEPTAGVDIELREQLWKFVLELKKQNVTVLLTTHYLEEAENLCDRVGIIDHGLIQKIDQTKNLIQMLTSRVVRIECRSRPEPMVFTLAKGETVGHVLVREKLNIEDIADIRIEEGTLEEAFRKIIRGQA